jgi:hypothetical protein
VEATVVWQENHNDLKIGELPQLQILSVDEVVFHEEPDMERVANLVDRFGADGVLKNPPVVASRNDSARRILLDGANRVTALRKLDFPHVLVQVIDYSEAGLVLDRWHHAVEHLPADRLLEHAATIAGVAIETDRDPAPVRAETLCRLHFPDGRAAVLGGAGDLLQRVTQLKSFTNVYHRMAYMDRVSYTDLDHLQHNYRHLEALVTFPMFSKEELVTITEAGILLPSGITRVLLPKRALRFNPQLDFLRSRLSIQEKNRWLAETVQQKISDKAIRFYREPTFFFDE